MTSDWTPTYKLHFDPFPSHLSLLRIESFVNKSTTATTFQRNHHFCISVPSAHRRHYHSSIEIAEFLATAAPLSRVVDDNRSALHSHRYIVYILTNK